MLRSCRGGGRREITKFSVCASFDIWNERAVYLFIYPHTHEYTRYETHYVISIICTCLHPCSCVKLLYSDIQFCEGGAGFEYCIFILWGRTFHTLFSNGPYIYQMRYIFLKSKMHTETMYNTFAVKKHSSFSIIYFYFTTGRWSRRTCTHWIHIMLLIISSWWLTNFLALYVISL